MQPSLKTIVKKFSFYILCKNIYPIKIISVKNFVTHSLKIVFNKPLNKKVKACAIFLKAASYFYRYGLRLKPLQFYLEARQTREEFYYFSKFSFRDFSFRIIPNANAIIRPRATTIKCDTLSEVFTFPSTTFLLMLNS